MATKARRAGQKGFIKAARELQALLGLLNDLGARHRVAPLMPNERDYEKEVASLLGESERVWTLLGGIGPYWR